MTWVGSRSPRDLVVDECDFLVGLVHLPRAARPHDRSCHAAPERAVPARDAIFGDLEFSIYAAQALEAAGTRRGTGFQCRTRQNSSRPGPPPIMWRPESGSPFTLTSWASNPRAFFKVMS